MSRAVAADEPKDLLTRHAVLPAQPNLEVKHNMKHITLQYTALPYLILPYLLLPILPYRT